MPSFLTQLLQSLMSDRLSRPLHRKRRAIRRRIGSGTAVEKLEYRTLLSAVATVVEDDVPGGGINNATVSSNPSQIFDVQGTAYFIANDGINGYELWRINSSGVAEIVEDSVAGGGINPGSSSSNPINFTNVNGTLYFRATDATNGSELWQVNSSGIAEMVEDSVAGGGINPGNSSSSPSNLTNVNGTLYFRATDATNGYEVWRINTSGVAQIVEDAVAGGGINPGSAGSNPNSLTNVNGTLYFRAADATNGTELWRINGSGVAQIVEDSVAGGGINPGSSSSNPINLTNVNGTLYFSAVDATNGQELWRINSSGVAQIVEDSVAGGGINPGSSSSNPINLTNVNGTLYFRATDATNGYELWRINSSGVAQIVEDAVAGGGIAPGSGSSYPRYLTNVNGTLYFKAGDGTNGDELWRISSSGVAQIVEDAVAGGGIAPGSANSNPDVLTNVNGTLYFKAGDGTNGTELWRINSSGVAQIVEDAVAGGGLNPGSANSAPSRLTNVNGTLYFNALDATNGYELWRINSSGVAEIVEDSVAGGGINPGSSNSNPRYLTNVNGTLYFNALDATNGTELWRINSSGVAEIVEDSVAGGGINPGSANSNPSSLTNVNGTLYFRALDATNGVELWRVNSSGVAQIVEDSVAGGGINPGSSSSNPSYLTNVNGTLYFRATDATNGYELWRINSSGVAQIVEDAVAGGGINPGSPGSNPGNLTNVNGTLYFNATDATNGYELWRINSSGVAQIVEDAVAGGGINPGNSGSNPRYLTNVNGTLYFKAGDATNGYELWRINSSGVAQIVEDAVAGGGINPGSTGSYPNYLTNVNGTLYFRAVDATNGSELWRINSSGVAQIVEDAVAGGGINPGSSNSNPRYLTNVNGTLYFNATDATNGYELWRINSSGVAQIVEDAVAGGGINPGNSGSNPRYLTNVNGTLYFKAGDATNGYELWRINSSGVAQIVEDAVAGGGIAPGSSSSNPFFLTNVNGTLYFSALDATNGQELWRINSSGVAQIVEDAVAGGGINPGSSNSNPRYLTNVNGTLYFRALDATNGDELWRINNSGVAEIVEDAVAGGGINPGIANSSPSQMIALNNILYFVADDGFVNGNELWSLPLNEAPTDITLTSSSLPENAGPNAVIGSLNFADPDPGDTVIFTLPVGLGNNSLFNISGSSLRATNSFDFEAGTNSYSITIRATDAGGLSYDEVFTISVTDVNDNAPVITTAASQSVPENTTFVAALTSTDADTVGTNPATFTITGGSDSALFDIVAGNLVFKAAKDFETNAHSYAVQVSAFDGVNTTNKLITVALTDVNDNAPVITTLAAQSVPENTTFVAALTSTDADTVGTNPATFTITGGSDSALFDIVAGNLVFKAAKDFETNAHSYAVQVSAFDGVNTTNKLITVALTDVNDSAPVITTLAAQSVPENTTFVAALSSTDADTVGTNPASFAISGGADAALFDIVSGNLVFKATKDFETDAHSYAAQVSAFDGVNTTNKLITVNLTDVNEAPTSIALSNNYLPENAGLNFSVGTLSGIDPDATDSLTFSLPSGLGDNGHFNISGTSLRATNSFDFESGSSYSITVRATDAGGLTFDKTFTINVTDVNEAPTAISLSNSSLPENAGLNFPVGTLSGTDPDAGGLLNFTLPTGVGNNNQFNISGTSLRANDSFDFEAGGSYSITVRATDAGGLTFDKTFTITVTDVNESPTDVSLPNTLVAENLPTGTNVGSFQTVDPDSGNTFTYALVTGTGSDHNASFTIAGDTLKTSAAFNFEAQSSYSIRIRSTDQNGLYVEKVFTISVTNVTELGGIDTQLGQTQRSYVRYLDVLFDRPDDIMSMVNNGRFQLTKMDLNGLNPSGVALSPGMFSAVGNSARLDFGVNGLGGNRNTTAGDGYYELGVDMDGNGTFESKKYFYRLLGDVNGDRKVDTTDSSLVTSAFGTTNANRDVNGDGTVNANDRTLLLRSVGRKLKDDLFADD